MAKAPIEALAYDSAPYRSRPVYDLGVEPPRLGATTGAPWPHTQRAVPQRPDAAEATNQARPAAYALRMETVEPVFGQIKQGRGFRQFLLRGLAKVNREWLLICVGHNLLKLFRFEAGMSGKVRGEGGTGNDRSAPRKNCCRRIIPADRHSQLVNLQTGC